MNRLLNAIAILIFLGFSSASFTQEISEGTYIGQRRGIVPKYIIMDVQGASIDFEMFTRWQGSWLPYIGSWDNDYEPQKLKRNLDGTLSNENIIVSSAKSSSIKLKGIAKNTFAGKVKFKLKKTSEIPKSYQRIKAEAIEFTENNVD